MNSDINTIDFFDVAVIDDDFDEIWKMQITNEGLTVARWRGPHNNKSKALKAYKARIKEGYTHNQMVEGVKGYVIYQGSSIGNKYVMMLSTFFGVDKHFESFRGMKLETNRRTKDIPIEEQLNDRSWAY
jgi:hypothetical protein